MGYDKKLLTPHAAQEYVLATGSIMLPPLYKNREVHEEICIYYALFVKEKLKNENIQPQICVSTVQTINKVDNDFQKENDNIQILLKHKTNKKNLNIPLLEWSQVTKGNLMSQLVGRIAYISNLYLNDLKKIEEGKEPQYDVYSKSNLLKIFKIKDSPFSYFQGAIILAGLDYDACKECINDSIGNKTISQSLKDIKKQTLIELKKIWQDTTTESSQGYEIKTIAPNIFYNFLNYHGLK